MIQFYSSDISDSLSLGAEESAHCIKVLRKKTGDVIFVTDGKGRRYECKIEKADFRKTILSIIRSVEVPKLWHNKICLAVAPTKNSDRMSWLVEKATEIGVDEICFVLCQHGERKNINLERLKKNAVSAMNQSLKTRMPDIYGIEPLDFLFERRGDKFFGYCSPDIPRLDFAKVYSPGNDVTILIGPEGDFSENEVKELMENKFRPITFGNERLRTETAALYGITGVHVLDNFYKD